MRAYIKMTGDDMPVGGMLVSAETEENMEKFLDELRRTYPGVEITDVTPEPDE